MEIAYPACSLAAIPTELSHSLSPVSVGCKTGMPQPFSIFIKNFSEMPDISRSEILCVLHV
jgi:hypothetical protein